MPPANTANVNDATLRFSLVVNMILSAPTTQAGRVDAASQGSSEKLFPVPAGRKPLYPLTMGACHLLARPSQRMSPTSWSWADIRHSLGTAIAGVLYKTDGFPHPASVGDVELVYSVLRFVRRV